MNNQNNNDQLKVESMHMQEKLYMELGCIINCKCTKLQGPRTPGPCSDPSKFQSSATYVSIYCRFPEQINQKSSKKNKTIL